VVRIGGGSGSGSVAGQQQQGASKSKSSSSVSGNNSVTYFCFEWNGLGLINNNNVPDGDSVLVVLRSHYKRSMSGTAT